MTGRAMISSRVSLMGTVLTSALLLVGCSPATLGSSEATPMEPASSVSEASGDAAETLGTLPVKGRAPKTGYDRDSFGSAWKDVDGNGCDTRNDILARDLVERQMQDSCVVLSGVLYPDPYTATNITFVRGKSLVDIDHVVALGNAWVTGAFQWDTNKKESFANDPLNLLAVSASANRQKSDADAATWLPKNRAYRCAYVARQIAVKAKYQLWVTAPEREAMTKVLASCPGEPLPTNASLPVPVPVPDINEPGTETPAAKNVKYSSCAKARAAGVTPITKASNPDLYALNRHLDRDGDGAACE